MQNKCELAEIGQLRPWPRPLLKPAPSSIRGTGHHEMRLAVTEPYLDEGLPACGVRLLLADCFQTL